VVSLSVMEPGSVPCFSKKKSRLPQKRAGWGSLHAFDKANPDNLKGSELSMLPLKKVIDRESLVHGEHDCHATLSANDQRPQTCKGR
jgi:hypothetical protein